jgi:hypothetical protein
VETATSTGRARRLTLAGLVWAALLATLLLATLAFSSRPSVSSAHVVDFERGRLPNDFGANVESRVEPVFAAVVTLFSHTRVEVRCWSPADWPRRASEFERLTGGERLGAWRAFTAGDRRTIELSPEICAGLARLADRRIPIVGPPAADALAWSLGALAHEAQHASGVRNEVRADCYGMQSIATAAGALGRTAAEGRYLAALYWKHWYVWLDQRYRSRECRDGGRLDLNPGIARWP